MDQAVITAGFKNLDELREVMRRYIDRKTAEDVGLALPKRHDVEHLVDMTPEQEGVYQALRVAAETRESDATGDGHIFSIMSRMGKASLGLSLLGKEHAGARSPKIEAAAAEIVKGAAEGGQVVFCDHNDVHETIVAALVRAGIPRERIAIVNAAATPSGASRQRVSDQFNDGKIDVVIGNTATMGEGINLQKRTTDMHHLDLPWEPASIQQRNRRGLRQGNKKEAVRIHTYLAKRSFDGYRWQTVMAKKDWQDLLWNSGDRVENLAREGAMTRAERLIMLSADPEAALKKYREDKAAAAQRKTAEERGKVVDMFGRFQEIRRSVAALRAKGTGGAAPARAEQRLGRIKEALRDYKYFPDKVLLDTDQPALIEPVTGHAWLKGRGFELDPSAKDAPLHWAADSDKPSKWVVTDVDRGEGTVIARPYGTLGGATSRSRSTP